MNKKIIIRMLLILAIVINCITIFKFSAEKSEKSDQTSGKVINTIIELNPKTRSLSQEEKEKEKQKIITPVRKTAHFTIYLSLGVWTYLLFKTFKGKEKLKVLGSVCYAFLYACTDEFHQRYVPGRSGEFRDVCIDTCGAIVGVLIIYVIVNIIKKKNKKS